MHMTAYARLEQFRIDIEKQLAEKALHELGNDHAEEGETPKRAAGDNAQESTMQDAAGSVAARNLF
jgi:hypothetical protein